MRCRYCAVKMIVTKVVPLNHGKETLRYRMCLRCKRRPRTLEVELTDHVEIALEDAGKRFPPARK